VDNGPKDHFASSLPQKVKDGNVPVTTCTSIPRKYRSIFTGCIEPATTSRLYAVLVVLDLALLKHAFQCDQYPNVDIGDEPNNVILDEQQIHTGSDVFIQRYPAISRSWHGVSRNLKRWIQGESANMDYGHWLRTQITDTDYGHGLFISNWILLLV